MNVYTKTEGRGSSLRIATFLSIVALTLLFSCPADGDGASSVLPTIVEEIKDKDPAILYNADMHENAQSLFSRGDVDNPYLFTFGITTVHLLEELRGELTITGDTNNDGEVEELYQTNVPLRSFTAGGVALKNTAMLKQRMYVMDNNALVSMQKDTTMAVPSVYKENDYIVGIGLNGDNRLDYDMLPEDLTLRVKILYDKEVLKESTTQVSKADPYSIYTWRDLQHMSDDLDGDYEVQNDIIFPEVGHYGYEKFRPIGYGPQVTQTSPVLIFNKNIFMGTFEGNNHKIEGLYINPDSNTAAGLFGLVKHATIKNIRVLYSDGHDHGHRSDIGGLIGSVLGGSSTIENAHVYAMHDAVELKGRTSVGGLIGQVKGPPLETSDVRIENSSAHINVRVAGYSAGSVGGLIGYASHVRIKNSYATGNVFGGERVVRGNISGGGGAGGLIGGTFAIDAEGVYATGTVEGGSEVGGLLGSVHAGGRIIGYSSSKVKGTGKGANIGGLVGYMDGVHDLIGYSTGDVEGCTNVGGMVGRVAWRAQAKVLSPTKVIGYSEGDIESCAGGTTVGGLVGSILVVNDYFRSIASKSAHLINGYATGKVRGDSDDANRGSLIGYIYDRSHGTFDGYHAVSSAINDNKATGFNGNSITISTVTDDNYQEVFQNFVFGDEIGQWTWVGDGQWPAVNIGDVAPAEEQPLE